MQSSCAASEMSVNFSLSLSTVEYDVCIRGLIAFSDDKLECVATVQLCICYCRCVPAYSKFESQMFIKFYT